MQRRSGSPEHAAERRRAEELYENEQSLDAAAAEAQSFPFVRGIRGKGLILGLELEMDGSKIVEACMQEGLLINSTAYKVLRFVPPLIITEREIDRGLGILEKVLARQ